MTTQDQYGFGTVLQNTPGISWTNPNNVLTDNGVCALATVVFPPSSTQTLEMNVTNFSLGSVASVDSVQGRIQVNVNTVSNPYTVRFYFNDGTGWCPGHTTSGATSYGSSCSGSTYIYTCSHFVWTKTSLETANLKVRARIEGAAGDVRVDFLAMRANYTPSAGEPEQPIAPSLSANCTNINITATKPNSNGGTLFKWEYQMDTVNTFNSSNLINSGILAINSGSSTDFATHAAISPSTLHYVRVRYQNVSPTTWSLWSSASSVTSDGVPGQAADPVLTSEPDSVTSGKSQVTVTQGTAPSFNGCTTSESYQSEIAPDNSGAPGTFTDLQTDTTIGSTRTIVHRGLTPGGVYWVRHRFNNSVGNGAWSNAVSITVDNVPSAPTVVGRNNSKSINSSPPPDKLPRIIITKPPDPIDNGDPLTHWQWQRAPDNAGSPGTWGAWSSDIPITTLTQNDDNVALGTKYFYRGRFKNGVGYGVNGTANYILAYNVPDATLNPTFVSATKTSITFAWTAPTTNGSTILSYIYEWKKHDGNYVSIDTGSTSLQFTKTGLTAGTRYYFSIRTHADLGDSLYSTSSAFYTLPGVISNAVASAVDNTAGQIVISWDPYVFDSDQAITTQYKIYVADTTGGTYTELVTSQSTTTYTHTGLGNGVQKYYKIVAINPLTGDIGAIADATEITAVTINIPTAPGTPVFVSDTTTSITFSWTAPTFDGGNEPSDTSITNYHYWWWKHGTPYAEINTNSTSLTAIKSALQQNTKYYFQVFAFNSAGLESTHSANGGFYTQPDIPANPVAVGEPGQTTLSWNAVTIDTDDITQTFYDIDVSNDGSTNWTSLVTGLTTLSYVHSGLGNGVTKYYRIRARNPYASSNNTTTISATTDVVPSTSNPPSVIVPDGTSGTLRVTRSTLPSNGGDPITHWSIQSSDDNGITDPFTLHTVDIPIATLSVDVTTDYSNVLLGDGKTQYYKIAFKNGVGYGAYSTSAQNTTPSVPGTPLAPNLSTPSHNTIVIDRPPLTANNGESIDTWTIRKVKGLSGSFSDYITLPITTLSYTDFPIESGTWRYEVYFTNAVGNSLFSGISIANATPQIITKFLNTNIKVVNNGITILSNTHIKTTNSIIQLINTRVKNQSGQIISSSNTRIKTLNQSSTTLSDLRVKQKQNMIILSDIRLAILGKSIDILSDTRIQKSFALSLLSDSKLKKMFTVTLLSDSSIKVLNNTISYPSLTRIKILQQSTQSITNSRVLKTQKIDVPLLSRIQKLGNSLTFANRVRISILDTSLLSSDARIKKLSTSFAKTSNTKIILKQSITTLSNTSIKLINDILILSDVKIKKTSVINSLSNTRILSNANSLTSILSARIIKSSSFSILSQSVIKKLNNNFTILNQSNIKKNLNFTMLSNTRIKNIQQRTKISDIRIKKLGQSFSNFTNTRVKKIGVQMTSLSDTRISGISSLNKIILSRVKKISTSFDVVSNTRLIRRGTLSFNSSVRILTLSNIITATMSSSRVRIPNQIITVPSNTTIIKKGIIDVSSNSRILVVNSINIVSSSTILGVKGNLKVIFKKFNTNI